MALRPGEPCTPCARERRCVVEGCRDPLHGRGMCTIHYNRWRRHGDPLHRDVKPRKRRARQSAEMQARAVTRVHATLLEMVADYRGAP